MDISPFKTVRGVIGVIFLSLLLLVEVLLSSPIRDRCIVLIVEAQSELSKPTLCWLSFPYTYDLYRTSEVFFHTGA
jgi:hypothetical protein